MSVQILNIGPRPVTSAMIAFGVYDPDRADKKLIIRDLLEFSGIPVYSDIERRCTMLTAHVFQMGFDKILISSVPSYMISALERGMIDRGMMVFYPVYTRKEIKTENSRGCVIRHESELTCLYKA